MYFVIIILKASNFQMCHKNGLTPLSEYDKHFVSHPFAPKFSQDVCSKQLLMDHLQANGLQLTSILGDGNCFFSAIAENIKHSPDQWKPVLNTIASDETNLSTTLRKAMVEELLGPKRPEYEAFLSPLVLNYELAVKCFLDQSIFNSPIGNAMPLAMARAIQCLIVIFYFRYLTATSIYFSCQH